MKSDVHANIAELRRYLGSVQRPLSLEGLAKVLNARDDAKRNASTVKRWESGAEPDIHSIRMMAGLAGVTFEEFALGTGRGIAISPEPEPLARSSERHQEKKKGA